MSCTHCKSTSCSIHWLCCCTGRIVKTSGKCYNMVIDHFATITDNGLSESGDWVGETHNPFPLSVTRLFDWTAHEALLYVHSWWGHVAALPCFPWFTVATWAIVVFYCGYVVTWECDIVIVCSLCSVVLCRWVMNIFEFLIRIMGKYLCRSSTCNRICPVSYTCLYI